MNRQQLLTVLSFLLIFALLYFGCDTKSQEQQALEKSRAQNIELVNITKAKQDALKSLSGTARAQIIQLEEQLSNASIDEDKLEYLKSLASIWYQEGEALISSDYAFKIAELDNSEEAWSIAGTSYAIAAQREQEERFKKYAAQKSRASLENAISINPQNVDHKVNLALSYVEAPSEENPMKGILMLLDLNKEYPDNTTVLLQLGRLAIQTNQLDKAKARLISALEINPDLVQAHCLLYEVYTAQGNVPMAEQEKTLCDKK
ncbi:MAG: tetratricopeptide repeat protein [Saprospiraceae bacterium]|nr:tetratricopeptide repeat protein [Saprospiraceae bacterium]